MIVLYRSRSSEMQAMETDAERTNFPIIGPASGYLCYQVARMISAKQVFRARFGIRLLNRLVRPGSHSRTAAGRSITWSGMKNSPRQARTHLSALGYDGIIHYHVGEAVQTLREMLPVPST